MATSTFFNNQEIKIPGVYSTIKSGIKNPAIALAFGNTLVIDTGSSRGIGGIFGGGAGINGTLKNGKDAIYTFDNSRDFRNFIRGGLWWQLAQPLFNPGGGATNGISSLTFVRALATTPAEVVVPFGGQDESDSDGDGTNNGSVTIQVRDEGFVGNGVFGDETRAKSTITVTNAGTSGNTIAIVVQGETVGTHTVVNGQTIAQVVAALVTSINSTGICEVFSSNSTQIVIYAPRGKADSINGITPTISVTGTVAGSAGAFSGGVEGSILTRGYGVKVVAGSIDTSKFIVKFYRGTFKGLDTDLTNTTPAPWDNIAEIATKPELVVQSPEILTVQELVDWMQDDTGKGYIFNQYFKLKTYTVAASDEILAVDITNNYIKAEGGTESYSASALNEVLDNLDGNYDFILADKWGLDALAASNQTILDWITNTAKIKPDLYVAAGNTVGEFTFSRTVAEAYDSMYVTVVHGGAKKVDTGGRSFKEYDSIYKAAYLLGREAGLEPQIPLTFKSIGINGELHQLKDKEVVQGLDAGVLMTRLDNGSFDCVKGINSLQNNDNLVNADGSTPSKQLGRIKRQLNKEITVNAKQQLLKKPNGANRNTVGPDDVIAWLEGYLSSKVATDTQDNLILSFSNISVEVNQDIYDITYSFVPNFEVSILLFTGFILDPNS